MNKVIFLNGCSSSGKTQITKAIQYLSKEPWLTFGIDTLFKAMPVKYVGFGEQAEKGFHFVPGTDHEGMLVVEIRLGPYAEKVCESAPKIARQLAEDDHNLIIDEIIWDRKSLESYSLALKSFKVYFINVICDLPLLKEREILRGDRAWYSARDQYNRMKELKWKYDLVINTSSISPFENAKQILKHINVEIMDSEKN